MSKINVLFVFAEPFSYGGQEAFAINMYNKFDKRKFNIDFYTPFKCDNREIKSILSKNNDYIYFDGYEFDSKLRKKNYIRGLKKFIKDHKYDIIHINSGSTFALAMGSKIVKKESKSKVVVHSHATGVKSLRHTITNAYLNRYFKYADYFIACSTDAGKFRFSTKIINRKNYMVIKNGIDIEKYKFNKDIRDEYRKKFDIAKDEFVIGHVGRFSSEKNHSFLIDLYSIIKKKYPKVRLMLVGNGQLYDDIHGQLKREDLLENTIILGKRNDVNKILQAIDLFVFPSIFEGLGIAAIESQISGLTTICSSEVPEQVKIIDRCYFIDLDNKDEWLKTISNQIDKRVNRDYEKMHKITDGFDSAICASNLENVYTEILNEE